jgi:hypothetical protein
MPDIKIHVHTQGGDTHAVQAPSDIKAEELISQLVEDLSLPKTDPEGHPVAWTIDDKDTGKTLEDEKTLEQSGVAAGHHLYLRRQVTAGNSCADYLSNERRR